MSVTRNNIIDELKQIEQHYNVKVLYACEAGSRCWHIESEDSDYDVRFIYAHEHEWYLNLNDGRDVIEINRPDDMLDIGGWDLRKALRLFKKSNPPLLEWLYSDTVYMADIDFPAKLKALELYYYNPTAAAYHYFHMAKGNYRDYLQGDGHVWLKKYLYVLRPLLCVRWIEAKQNVAPPVNFKVLVETLPLDERLKISIMELLYQKQAGAELGYGSRWPIISDFISSEIKRLDDKRFSGKPKEKKWNYLNKLFIETVYKRPLAIHLDIV